MRLLFFPVLLAGVALAGGAGAPLPAHSSSPQARAAYQQVKTLLNSGQLGEARKVAALAVQATAAQLPPCVTPGSAQGSTFSLLFRPGEALRLMTNVGGGRINQYELRQDGIYRVWQAQKNNPDAAGSVLAQMLGVLPQAAQCGTPPQLSDPLEVFSFNPFTGSMLAEIWQPNGQIQRVKTVSLEKDLGGGRMSYGGLPDAPPLDLH